MNGLCKPRHAAFVYSRFFVYAYVDAIACRVDNAIGTPYARIIKILADTSWARGLELP